MSSEHAHMRVRVHTNKFTSALKVNSIFLKVYSNGLLFFQNVIQYKYKNKGTHTRPL